MYQPNDVSFGNIGDRFASYDNHTVTNRNQLKYNYICIETDTIQHITSHTHPHGNFY